MSAERNGAWLHIIVENPYIPIAQARRRRVGLANVRARLRAMHGGDAAARRRTQRHVAGRGDAAGRHGRGLMTVDLLRVVIVDDEPLARTVVHEHIKDHPRRRGRRRMRQRPDAVKAVAELSLISSFSTDGCRS